MNYFDVYDLPVTLELDKGSIRKQYILNSRKYHPDHHADATPEEREEALRLSTLNTEAYETLGDLGKRLDHIMVILGGGTIEAPKLSPVFLMEMMEINESVESMTEEEKQALRTQIIERDKQAYADMEALHHRDLMTASDDELNRVKSYYFERKYLLRILENLDNLASL